MPKNAMESSEKTAGDPAAFKMCNICQTKWASRDDFLCDPDIELVGYQVHFEELTAGIFYFNHSCKGTLAFYANDFMDLYAGPVFSERATNSDACPGYCLHKEKLESCPAQCECASVREVLSIIKQWLKKKG
jgi:hypothetical protein